MKQGWIVKKLGDVCETGAGGTPLKAHKDYYENGDVPWLLSGEVSQGNIYKSTKFITKKGLKNSSAKLFPVNTVLVAMYGATAGQVGILKFVACTNQAVCGILPNDRTIPEYIYYCLLSKSKELISQAVGGAQPNISQIKIKNTKIPIPPLPEQQHIVSILDEAFEAIAKAKVNAEKNLKNARELFESYLQSMFENKEQNWENKMLKEIGIAQTGTTPKTSDKENYGNFIPFIKPADIDITGNGEIRYNNDGLSEKGLKLGRKMADGSILMVCIGATIGKIGFVDRAVSCNQQINTLTVKKDFHPKFFYYALSTKGFFNQVMNNAAQATIPIINKGRWERLNVNFPNTKAEQENIVQKLDALSIQTKKLEVIYQKKIADLDELKKSILQKAFNGELNLEPILA
jgi:type I restriction enzyme S subunit